jgi:hypothetical protein
MRNGLDRSCSRVETFLTSGFPGFTHRSISTVLTSRANSILTTILCHIFKRVILVYPCTFIRLYRNAFKSIWVACIVRRSSTRRFHSYEHFEKTLNTSITHWPISLTSELRMTSVSLQTYIWLQTSSVDTECLDLPMKNVTNIKHCKFPAEDQEKTNFS